MKGGYILSDFKKDFYTVEETAELFGVHSKTIRRMIQAGKIEHYKIGAQIRIAASELERLKVPAKTQSN